MWLLPLLMSFSAFDVASLQYNVLLVVLETLMVNADSMYICYLLLFFAFVLADLIRQVDAAFLVRKNTAVESAF